MLARIFGILSMSFGLLPVGCGKNEVSGDPTKSAIVSEASGEEPKNAPEPIAQANEQPQKIAEKTPVVREASPFEFPDDESGKLLSKLLRPMPLAKLPTPLGQLPKERRLPPALSEPEVPFSSNLGETPRLPLKPLAEAKPTALADRIPVELARFMPEIPAAVVMPEGPLSRVSAPDVRRPADVPILARPTPDRASLEDPSFDFAAASVIGYALPLRETSAPFVKVNLPDPFENVESAKPRTDLAETPASALGNPPQPKPALK